MHVYNSFCEAQEFGELRVQFPAWTFSLCWLMLSSNMKIFMYIIFNIFRCYFTARNQLKLYLNDSYSPWKNVSDVIIAKPHRRPYYFFFLLNKWPSARNNVKLNMLYMQVLTSMACDEASVWCRKKKIYISLLLFTDHLLLLVILNCDGTNETPT